MSKRYMEVNFDQLYTIANKQDLRSESRQNYVELIKNDIDKIDGIMNDSDTITYTCSALYYTFKLCCQNNIPCKIDDIIDVSDNNYDINKSYSKQIKNHKKRIINIINELENDKLNFYMLIDAIYILAEIDGITREKFNKTFKKIYKK